MDKDFPDVPVSKKPAEVRMGKGKGSVEYWACRVKPGRIMFEVDGVNIDDARKAMTFAAAKLPINVNLLKEIYNEQKNRSKRYKIERRNRPERIF